MILSKIFRSCFAKYLIVFNNFKTNVNMIYTKKTINNIYIYIYILNEYKCVNNSKISDYIYI